jgi:hypothetical protein
MNYGNGAGGSWNNAKPTALDFKIDCDICFAKCCKAMSSFRAAYIDYDSEDSIGREMHAQKIMGDGRRGLEQGLGALLIKRGIYPSSNYFQSIRQVKAGTVLQTVQCQ